MCKDTQCNMLKSLLVGTGMALELTRWGGGISTFLPTLSIWLIIDQLKGTTANQKEK